MDETEIRSYANESESKYLSLGEHTKYMNFRSSNVKWRKLLQCLTERDNDVKKPKSRECCFLERRKELKKSICQDLFKFNLDYFESKFRSIADDIEVSYGG